MRPVEEMRWCPWESAMVPVGHPCVGGGGGEVSDDLPVAGGSRPVEASHPDGSSRGAAVREAHLDWRAPRRSLSRRQVAILWFIARYMTEHGRAPSQLEIGSAVGLSGSFPVSQQLGALVLLGRIVHQPHSARAIRLLPTPGVQVVPVVRCERHGQDLPADHHCPPDWPDMTGGSPSDMDIPEESR